MLSRPRAARAIGRDAVSVEVVVDLCVTQTGSPTAFPRGQERARPASGWQVACE